MIIWRNERQIVTLSSLIFASKFRIAEYSFVYGYLWYTGIVDRGPWRGGRNAAPGTLPRHLSTLVTSVLLALASRSACFNY